MFDHPILNAFDVLWSLTFVFSHKNAINDGKKGNLKIVKNRKILLY